MQHDVFNPTDIHKDLRDLVARFARENVGPQAASHDETEQFNHQLFRESAELGLFGITAPEKFGGQGLDAVSGVIVLEELSRFDPAYTLSHLVQDTLVIHNLSVNGSDAQKEKYLPRAIAGEIRGGIAMTDPEGGSDVLAMQATARREGGHWVINGRKQFITNGDGDFFLFYAKTGPRKYDVSLFVVESGYPGFSTGQKERKMGMRQSPTVQLSLDDCIVPLENLVGLENQGMVSMMKNLEYERVSLAAMSTGIALRCFEIMNKYASERSSFGRPIREHGPIAAMLAESYVDISAARLLVYHAAAGIGSTSTRLQADAAKLFAEKVGVQVADRAIQVLGGYGYCRGFPVERLYRDARLLKIGGGTTEILQKNIAADLGKLVHI